MDTERRRDADATAQDASTRHPGEGTRGATGTVTATALSDDAVTSGDERLTPPGLFVPSLLSGLDSDDAHAMRTAGYALVIVVDEYPDSALPVAGALVERLAADDSRREVARTLATLACDHADAVRESLRTSVDRETARRLLTLIREAETLDIPRALRADGGDGTEFATAFRQVIRLDERPPGPDTGDAGGRTTQAEPVMADETGKEVEGRGSGSDERDDRSGRPDGAARTKRERIERTADSERFGAIAHRSAFDDLSVVAPETERRYGNVVRARARTDDTERGVAVRLLHVPDDRTGFDSAVGECLREWAHLLEAPGVVTVADWGERPQPWVVTEYVEDTLANQGRVEPARALAHARQLTETLVQLHQQNVVHAGIDPRNVVYAADALDGGRPMLDNVGLLSVFRRHFDPADYLDPRYAAPEYFDDQYGRLDHATDVYQLGMVLYRLFAGRHPFDGGYDEIRRAVLDDRPTAPSEVTPALPDAVDDVVAKATAKQKLTRYETAHGLHQDVARICQAVLD